jgi:hypothetical protein
MKTKYGSIKTVIDNVTFDSQAEGRRYLELKMLLKAKKISDLQLQPKFELQQKFTDNKGVNHRAIAYVADFQYLDDKGNYIVEDVKGYLTEVYKLKKKIFLFKYDAFDFREI